MKYEQVVLRSEDKQQLLVWEIVVAYHLRGDEEITEVLSDTKNKHRLEVIWGWWKIWICLTGDCKDNIQVTYSPNS
jgi:hypothetical protein